MKIKKSETEKILYDTIPSQDCMYLMHKFSIHKQMAQIPTSFILKTEFDLEILQKAFNIVISRNDSLRLAFVKKGGKLMQYFREPYSYKVPLKYFRSRQQQEEFCAADAKKPVRFEKGEIFRICFFRISDGSCGIYANFTHMITDAMGISFFYMDLFQVYASLVLGEPLPKAPDSYEEYIISEQKKLANEKKMAKHESFYKEYFLRHGEPFYAGVHGMDFLNAYRKKKKNPEIRVPLAYNPLYSKCDFVTMNISPEVSGKILNYCMSKQLAPECLFQVALRTHCSAVNERVNDVSMMSVCSKRATIKEKNMMGCLAQPVQMRTVFDENMSFDGAIDETTDVRTSLYKHSAYPYTKARTMSLELFGFSPIQGPNSLMLSWIPLPVGGELGMEFDFRTYNLERYFTPVYVITMPDPEKGGVRVCYMYRTKLSTKQQIEKLHENMVSVIEAGIDNPQITLDELLDKIEKNN